MIDVKKLLNQQGKLALTHNLIFPLVNLVQGIQNDSRLNIKAIPRGKEDGAVGEAMSECLRWMWDGEKADRQLSQVFLNGNIAGRGWIGIEQVEDDLDLFGTKTLFSVVDTGEMRYDRKSRNYDLSDCDYLIRSRVLSRSLAKILWREKVYELSQYYSMLDGSYRSSRLYGAMFKNEVEIFECWYRVYEMRTLAIDFEQGQIHDITDLKDEEIGGLIEQYPHLQIKQKKRQVMKYARTAGMLQGVHLDSGSSPYEDNFFPYVPYFAYHTRDMDFGIPHNIMDAQREVNKRDSQVLHYLNMLPKTRIITDNPEDADTYEQGADIAVLKGNYRIIPPPDYPLAYARASESGEAKLKKISGISDDLRGIKSGNDSGVVVDIRRQQSMSSIASLFDNLQWTSERMAKVMTSRVRQFLSHEQIARILGEEKANPEVIQAIKTLGVETYDFAIAQAPSSPTMRAENWAKIKDLMQIMPLPPEVVIEASDVVQKDQILADFEAKKQAMEGQQIQEQAAASGGINPNIVPEARR